jgi:hypothetical protein
VNETRVAMEVEPTLEAEIREGQLEDAKLKEIRQLIRDNKTSDFSEDSQGTRYLRCQTTPKEDIIARLWQVSWLPPALLAKRRVVNQIWKLKVRACEINECQARYTVAAIPTSNTEEEKQVVISTRWQHDDPHRTAEI